MDPFIQVQLNAPGCLRKEAKIREAAAHVHARIIEVAAQWIDRAIRWRNFERLIVHPSAAAVARLVQHVVFLHGCTERQPDGDDLADLEFLLVRRQCQAQPHTFLSGIRLAAACSGDEQTQQKEPGREPHKRSSCGRCLGDASAFADPRVFRFGRWSPGSFGFSRCAKISLARSRIAFGTPASRATWIP